MRFIALTFLSSSKKDVYTHSPQVYRESSIIEILKECLLLAAEIEGHILFVLNNNLVLRTLKQN